MWAHQVIIQNAQEHWLPGALVWNISVPCLYPWIDLEKRLTACYSLVISLLLVNGQDNNNDIVFALLIISLGVSGKHRV